MYWSLAAQNKVHETFDLIIRAYGENQMRELSERYRSHERQSRPYKECGSIQLNFGEFLGVTELG